MGDILFSILIPTYKSIYLKEAIDSCLNQSIASFEVVILNDSSPEDIDSIVKSYDDSRIRYFCNDINCGGERVVDNWNKCLSYAQGEWIICMGDDDRLRPNCLEVYSRLIEKHPGFDVFHGRTVLIDDRSNFMEVTALRPEVESVYSLIWHRWFGNRQQYIGDFLFRRDALLEKGGFFYLPYAWASDDITAVMMSEKKGIANTYEVVFEYRINPFSISNSYNNITKKIEAITREKEWYQSFLSHPAINEDEFFRLSITDKIDKHFRKKVGLTISRDIIHNPFRSFYWYFFRRKYKIQVKTVFYGIFVALSHQTK